MLLKRILRSISESQIQRRNSRKFFLSLLVKSRLLIRRLFYTQPCSQILISFNWRQGTSCVVLSKTASISTNSIASSGSSGRITLLTRKCFRLWLGFTAVHLVRSSFFGLRGFWSLEGIALKFVSATDEFS